MIPSQKFIKYIPRILFQLKRHPLSTIQELWRDLKLLSAMLYNMVQGTYPQRPWRSIAAAIGFILYIFSPTHLIPDRIFVIGYLDEITLLILAIDFARPDLVAYREWCNIKR